MIIWKWLKAMEELFNIPHSPFITLLRDLLFLLTPQHIDIVTSYINKQDYQWKSGESEATLLIWQSTFQFHK